jgi:hypothetical protein
MLYSVAWRGMEECFHEEVSELIKNVMERTVLAGNKGLLIMERVACVLLAARGSELLLEVGKVSDLMFASSTAYWMSSGTSERILV